MRRNQLLKEVSGATLGASPVLSSYVSGFSLCTHEGLAGADLAAIANEAAISAARRGSMRIVQDDLLVRS